MNILDVLQQEWAIRALFASIMVGIMCGILGCFIVLRNMALIGDALSHAVLPGVVVAFMFAGMNPLGFFIGSVAAGLFSAVVITWIQQNVKTKNDAAIGIVFTAMFSLGVMGISWISHKQGVHLDLKDFLFGNVLGVGDEDLWLTAAVTLTVIGAVIVFYRPDGSSESWAHTNLWETAKENKLINVIEDEGGRMAYKFGALTSGQTYLYDFSGKLVFSGGITETRGHIGNNEGRRSIAAILDKTQTLGNRSKVFGCAILSSNEIKKLTREIKNASN